MRRRRRRGPPKLVKLAILTCIGYFIYTNWSRHGRSSHHTALDAGLSLERLQADLSTCSKLRSVPQDPHGPRERNGRYVDGHKAVLIRNATVWTGEPAAGTSAEDARAGKGYAWISADVYLEYGLIKRVEANIAAADLASDHVIYDAYGRQLTSGIVDMHSHAGVDSLPSLRGNEDTNELSNDITPYVRSLDGINPLDHQIRVIKSGGVTTSLILPGSGNNIGGEAFVIKHAVGNDDGRPELSAEDMLADPDKNWRYMKMACGENAKSVYGQVGRGYGPFSRLGEAWYFRHAFEQATALVSAQNDWCETADRVGAEGMGSYLPQDLQWESLGALLRGQVLLNTHCYTIPDLEAFIRHTNEFKFKIRAFHHAHQTYLVPEVLKRAYGGQTPAAALFADNMFYKSESYVASEQAGKILYENGVTPVYVSDNPVLNAQHVVFEAAKAYKNGLPYHVALAGVTSASAELLGLGNRIGKVKPGFDADVVVWDSDPLAVGAAPVQVYIDGTPQFEEPVELDKPHTWPLAASSVLEKDREAPTEHHDVVFTGVRRVLLPGSVQSFEGQVRVVVRDSAITCIGDCTQESVAALDSGSKIVSLHNGYLVPPLTAFGSELGVEEITQEPDTHDGANSDESFSSAVDGLAFDGKNLEAAYSHGTTKAITAPTFEYGGFRGISAGFLTGAKHALEKGAVWNTAVALHYSLTKSKKTPSLSSAVGDLKARLLKAANTTMDATTLEEKSLRKVVQGKLPLVVNVQSADLTAALLRLKVEVEEALHEHNAQKSGKINLIIHGGAESHLLANELAEVNVGVVLAPFLAYAVGWDQRRSLSGAPLTNGTTIDVLHSAGVKVAIGTAEAWETRDLFLSAGIAYANGGGKISEEDALGFVSSSIYDLLGLEVREDTIKKEFVVFEGSPLDIDGRLIAVADGSGRLTVY